MGMKRSVLLIGIGMALLALPAVAADDAWHKIALDKEHVVSLTADPVRPSTLYAATSLGLLKSVDSGASWKPLGPDLPKDIPPSCVAVNPHDSKMVYVGYDGKGLFKSADSGNTWALISGELPNQYVRSMTISPKDPNLLYVGIQNGVALSTNGGQSWHMSFGFRRAANVNAIVINPQNPQYLFAATGGAGIYKSGNGGVSWKDINDGLSSLSILALHVDPENPDIVLAGAYHPATPTDLYVGESNGGVFRSVDGGRTWKETHLTNITIFSFASTAQHPGVIYAGAWGGAYRSVDKGETWKDINSGLDNAFLHKVHAIPGSPPTILGGTTFGLLSYKDVALSKDLPSKGGVPVYVWCIAGSVMLLGAVWWLMRRRRAQKNADGDNGAVW